jgi:hypothetical protein
MSPTFAASCPAKSDMVRIPDFTTADMVTCKVCGISLSKDKHGAKDKLWINVEFGALQKSNGDMYESDIKGYLMYWLDSDGRVLPTSVTNAITNYKTPQFGVVGPTTTCCSSSKYSGVYVGAKPAGASRIGVVPFTISEGVYYYLPIGATAEFTDSERGQTKIYTFTVQFTMTSHFEVLEFEMLVKDALAQIIDGVEKDMIAVISITTSSSTTSTTTTTTTTDSNTTSPGSRRLSATTVIVTFQVNVPVTVTIKQDNIDGDALKRTLSALAAASGVTLPTITGAPTVSEPTSELAGVPSLVAWAAPTASLALLPLLMAVLAVLQ